MQKIVFVSHCILKTAAKVVLYEQDAIDAEEELRRHVEDRLVRYKVPRRFEFVWDTLKDDAGKVQRAALRAERVAALEQAGRESAGSAA